MADAYPDRFQYRQILVQCVQSHQPVVENLTLMIPSTVAYGNEAQLNYSYGMPVLIALVKSYAARTEQVKSAAASLGAQQVVNADATDPGKSSQPSDIAGPPEANA